MADLVSVTIEETPVEVTIDSGTPEISIIDLNNPTEPVIISARPVEVAIANDRPIVHVSPNFGNLADKTAILDLLGDSLDATQFTPELAADLALMEDLWIRIGRDIEDLLVESDGESIYQSAQIYTDQQIASMVVSIEAVEDGVLLNTSLINQTAADITLSVTALETATNDQFTVTSARIDVTSSAIASNVTRMDNMDGTISQAQSDIIQEADRITLEVATREELETGKVDINTGNITLTAESLVANLTATDTLTGRMDSGELRLTANEFSISVLSQEVVDAQYAISTTQSITANRYGVVIEEDAGGELYISELELLVHPDWITATEYAIGNVVEWTDDKIYECILAHTASAANSPGSAATATYWVLSADSAKSEFNIRADKFSVITSTGSTPVLQVVGAGVNLNDPIITGDTRISNAEVTVNANGTLNNAGSGQVTTSGIGAETPTGAQDKIAAWCDEGADQTTITTIANAIDGTALITTGIIRDSGSNLVVNFDTATITLGAGKNLDLYGSMNVKIGADITLESTSTNQANLFFRGVSDNVEIGFRPTEYADYFIIRPETDNSLGTLIGHTGNRFEFISMAALTIETTSQYSSSVGNRTNINSNSSESTILSEAWGAGYTGNRSRCFINGGTSLSDTFISLISDGAIIMDSDDDISLDSDSGIISLDAGDNINLDAVNNISIRPDADLYLNASGGDINAITGVFHLQGLASMSDATAISTYSSRLAEGDTIWYKGSDHGNVTCRVYRSSGGVSTTYL